MTYEASFSDAQENFREAVLDALPRDISPRIASNWRHNRQALSAALRSVLYPFKDIDITKFVPWKTITIGTHKNMRFLKKDLIHNECDNNLCFGTSFPLIAEERQLDLVVLSVKEIGFDSGARYEEICAAVIALGLELCPAEVGPALRIAYKDQDGREVLHIAMEPIINPNGYHCIFRVYRGSTGLSLLLDRGKPYHFWYPYDYFVFVLPQKNI